MLSAQNGAHQATDLVFSAKRRKGAVLLTRSRLSEWASLRFWRLFLAAVLRPILGGALAVSEISWGLALAFRRNWIGSSTRQKARVAIKKQKHRGKSCSLHWRESFTILLCFFPRRTGLSYTSLHVVSQSEDWCSWKLIFIFYWMGSLIARAQRRQCQHRESAGPPFLITAH